MRMRSLLLSLALSGVAASALLPAQAAAAETLERIALVDVQRCIMETKVGKRAKKDLEKTFAKAQSRIDRKAKDVQQRFQDLQAKAAMLSQKELRKRQEELMRADQELQQLQYELQDEVMQKEALLTEKIYGEVAEIVEQLAKEENVQVVLVKSEMTVLWANPKLDLTNKVIVRYDKKNK
jgi:outer membrane protein